jgi:hypothetical protein
MLADAYGGDMRRWPEADRAGGEALVRESAVARARLAQADALDAMLDQSRVGAPSAALRQRIVSSAPKPRALSASVAPVLARSRLLRWLSGLGAIGVLTCGAVTGAAVVAMSGPTHIDADSLAGLYDTSNALDAGGA